MIDFVKRNFAFLFIVSLLLLYVLLNGGRVGTWHNAPSPREGFQDSSKWHLPIKIDTETAECRKNWLNSGRLFILWRANGHRMSQSMRLPRNMYIQQNRIQRNLTDVCALPHKKISQIQHLKQGNFWHYNRSCWKQNISEQLRHKLGYYWQYGTMFYMWDRLF